MRETTITEFANSDAAHSAESYLNAERLSSEAWLDKKPPSLAKVAPESGHQPIVFTNIYNSKITDRMSPLDWLDKNKTNQTNDFLAKKTENQNKPAVEYCNGKPSKFTDLNGREYLNTGKISGKNNPEIWIDSKNPVQPLGVYIEVNAQTGDVKLTDRQTNIVRTTTKSGQEITQYPDGGGRTIREIINGVESITVYSPNRHVREMQIENNRLTKYVDGNCNTYKMTGEKAPDGKPYYSAINLYGVSVDRIFTITADRTGNVVVRDVHNPDSRFYARREYNNGTVVTSAKDNSRRQVEDKNRVVLSPDSEQAKKAQRSPVIAETPPHANIEANAKYMKENFIGQGFTSLLRLKNADELRNKIGYGKEWDYKSPGPDQMNCSEYESFGNWHYGYLCSAAGLSKKEALVAAGAAQRDQGTSNSAWGDPGLGVGHLRFNSSGNYGDDPEDARQIARGYDQFCARQRRSTASNDKATARVAVATFKEK